MDTLTREERINKFAYEAYEWHKKKGHFPDRMRDWLEGVHACEADDRKQMMEDNWNYAHKKSKAKCSTI